MRPVEAIESGNRFASVWPFVRKEGFTLVELIVVITIIAVLLAAVVLALTGYIGRSETTACEADQYSLQRAVGAYYAANQSWPTNDGGMPGDLFFGDDPVTGPLVGGYITAVPRSDTTCDWQIDGSGNVVPGDDATDCPCD